MFSAGMTPRLDGVLNMTGRLGEHVAVPEGRAAAAIAARNALSAVVAAAGGPEQLAALVSLTVHIACAADFTELSAVADGASEAIAGVLALPPAARAAIGVQALPGGAPVEVQLVAALVPRR